MATEADTCRTYVLPKLYAAGWSDDQISEQRIAEIMGNIKKLLAES